MNEKVIQLRPSSYSEKLGNYIKELEEENKTFEDNNKDLNNQLDKLQEENKKLKESIVNLIKDDSNLQLRINKAIEYINKLKNFKIKYVMLEEKELYASEKDFVKDLLKILKGEKDEEL